MLHFPWSPASLHYVSCHPLPDTTREHSGTGAWKTRRGETSPTPYLAQPCPCTKAAETQHGTAPKGQNPVLKAGREPATSLLLLELEGRDVQGPCVSGSSTGESFPTALGGQHLEGGRARTVVAECWLLFLLYSQELQRESLQTKQQRPRHNLMTLLFMIILSTNVFL